MKSKKDTSSLWVVCIRLNIPIKSIRGEVRKNLLIIRSKNPLEVLSSAVLNGGFHRGKVIINYHVSEKFHHIDPKGYLKNVARSLNFLPEDVVGLMTAVDIGNVAIATQRRRDLIVSAVVTAGLSYTAKAGDVITPRPTKLNTINIILLINGNPTESCMVNAANTATESKSVALGELDVRSSFSKELASGTITDAIVVASTMRGKPIRYAGTGTELGKMVGISVKEAVREAIEKHEGVVSYRPLIQRLKERGIKIEDLVDTALELFVPYPRGVESKEKASELLKNEFEQALTDVNIAALVMAGLRLEEDGQHGLIPNLPNRTFKKDPVFLVADEILGMAIADYMAGSRGIFELVRFNKAKPGILKKLGPVADDVVAGLIAGVSSSMYTKASGR